MSKWGYRVVKKEHSHAVTVIAKKLAYPLSLQFGVVTPLCLEGQLKKQPFWFGCWHTLVSNIDQVGAG
jgi:hypothetical protein